MANKNKHVLLHGHLILKLKFIHTVQRCISGL